MRDKANQLRLTSDQDGQLVVQIDDLGRLIRQKRRTDQLTLQEAAEQSGVSPATLSRLERRSNVGAGGKSVPTPDVRTLDAVTRWLGVALSGTGFAPTASSPSVMTLAADSVPNAVEAHLRADRNLDPKTAEELAQMFRNIYSAYVGRSREEPNHAGDVISTLSSDQEGE